LQSQVKYGKIEEGDTMGTKRKVKIELRQYRIYQEK